MAKQILARAESANGAPSIGADVVARAEAALKRMTGAYEQRAAQDVARLRILLTELECGGAPEAIWMSLRAIAHDMKGQGGTFDYPLVSDIADMLSAFLKSTTPDTGAAESIGVFVDTLATVLDRKLTGNGGTAGTDLLDAIRAQHG
jgi:hypothetical protein